MNTTQQDEKRQRNLEKNRLAAQRCRQKKKDEQQKMREQVDILQFQNDTLQFAVRDLTHQVQCLRELLLAHDTCQCEGIKSFIRRTSASL